MSGNSETSSQIAPIADRAEYTSSRDAARIVIGRWPLANFIVVWGRAAHPRTLGDPLTVLPIPPAEQTALTPSVGQALHVKYDDGRHGSASITT
jgi:hypothetical protein